jgi:aspartate aminotransferase
MNQKDPNILLPMASRVDELEPEGAYRVLARAQALERTGRDVIHLEIGEPDFSTDPGICRAGIDAIEQGHTRYNPTPGIAELRQAIAGDTARRLGIDVRAEHVVVGPGAKPHLFFPTLALVGPGDEVVYPDPGFPTYEAMIKVAGGTPVPIPLVEENDFSFDLDALSERVNKQTRLIVLNSPSNPTGGVMPAADLERVAEIAQRFDCWVLSDEIYSRMCYDGAVAPSIAALDGMQDRTVIVDGFSKTYAMTGWRLGYGVMPPALAEKVSLLLVHAVGCTAHFTQLAGVEALLGPQDQVAETLAEYQRRRDTLVAGLNSIPGIHCQQPAGAFYAFPNIKSFGRTSSELADRLLEEAGVALLPGTAFGSGGEGYLRICYANSLTNIEKAIERIRDFCAAIDL